MEMMSPIECDMEDINEMLELLCLTDEIHLPMGKVDLYDRFYGGQPFYRIVTEDEWHLFNDTLDTKMAGLDEWKELYEVTERIKELEPWNDLWDVDIIGVPGIREREDTFISVLGHAGKCFGLCIYEGVEALNQLFLTKSQKQLNASHELLMYKQNALVCYWGDREELSKEQYRRVKELGFKYHGKNQWLYFLSFKEGFYPCDLNAEEVSRMIGYMKILETALSECRQEIKAVNFDNEKVAYIDAAPPRKMAVSERGIPIEAKGIPTLQITDDLIIARLRKAESSGISLEAEVIIPGVEFKDPEYIRHINVAICTLVDAESGMILLHEVNDPGEDPFINMADVIVEYTLSEGAPAEVHVSNEIMAAALDHVCECAGINLVRKNKLKHTSEIAEDIINFMRSK